jgi:hypothetical protein
VLLNISSRSSGSLATFTSRTILPVSSTMQTQNLQLSTSSPADYPIYWIVADIEQTAVHQSGYGFSSKHMIRISERPPRVFLFAGFARCKLCELFLLNAAEIVDQIENTGSYVCFQIRRNTNIRNTHKVFSGIDRVSRAPNRHVA